MYAVGYDIANSSRRTRIRSVLRQATPLWQKPFFVLDQSRHDALALWRELLPHLDEDHDGLALVAIASPRPRHGLSVTAAPAGSGIFLFG
ncbi:CRISPR-associated endonuclease Cas2 [Denitratimonas sp. CY0512]|uniref:CRISPR-associated endonuclease Cas2 n=1 Tax=Denitratimonas sp. CY0512 TaxID=3131940 RepID=UPI0030A09E1B